MKPSQATTDESSCVFTYQYARHQTNGECKTQYDVGDLPIPLLLLSSSSIALHSLLLDLGHFFSFLNVYTIGVALCYKTQSSGFETRWGH
jgi:hypothetical protein